MQHNLHLCASDRGVSETRKRDETTRKNIDVLREKRSSMLTIACRRPNAYIPEAYIHIC